MKRNLRAGFRQYGGFGLNVLSDDELYAIHCATLDVLWHTGVRITSKEAQDIFDAGGAIVERSTNTVRIPPYVAEDAIKSAPSTVLLAARNPKNDFVIESNRTGFTNFGEGINIIDLFTKKYRPSNKQDVADTARMCDAMSEIDVYERAVSAQDVPPLVAPLHEAQVAFKNTSKHLFMGCGNGKNLRTLVKMGEAVVGKENFKKRPIYSSIVCPTSPLQLVPECCEVIIESARAGITCNILSMALSGGSSPVTLAGTLITHNAEVLSGIILSQLTCKGSPVIYGSSTTIMDMKSTTAAVGAPELGMINGAVAKLAQYYLLPSWVAGG